MGFEPTTSGTDLPVLSTVVYVVRLKPLKRLTTRRLRLRWSIFNLENNNKNTEHSLTMTRSSTNFPKVAPTTILINVGKLMIIKETVKDRKYEKTNSLFFTLYKYLCLHNFAQPLSGIALNRLFYAMDRAAPTRVNFLYISSGLFFSCFVFVCISRIRFSSAFISSFFVPFPCLSLNNYSPKWRWLAVDFYRAAKRCFSIY